jgi:methyl-accepting chemotaxis protein
MNALRNAPIGVKIALAPLMAMLCLVAVAALGLLANRDLTLSLRGLNETTLPTLTTANEVQRRLGEVFAQTNQSLVWAGADFPAQRIDALDKAVAAELAATAKLLKDQQNLAIWDDSARAQLQAIEKAHAAFQHAALDALDMKSSGLATAGSFIEAVQDTYLNLDRQIEALADAQRRAAGETVVGSTRAAVRKGWGIGVGAAAALVFAALISWSCARLIVQPLKDAQRLAGAVARGDLTEQSTTALHTDETGRVLAALGELSRNLSEIVQDIRHTADEVRVASSEIASGNADLSARTESTAASLQQAAASVEQLSSAIRQSADNSRDAMVLARGASTVAREGGAIVGDVVSTMDAINSQAKKIAEIIGVIDGIAFQTNILALNAAVESARAGEQGRGFAVVASEVRTLAQRSADAAREIRMLISTSVEQIEAGAKKVQDAGQAMGRIVGAIEKVAKTVEDISHATGEQANGIAQVNQSVTEMDRSTQQNAAMVEQATAATVSLNQQAGRLVEMLGRFKTAGTA